jgi:hypothetical protein
VVPRSSEESREREERERRERAALQLIFASYQIFHSLLTNDDLRSGLSSSDTAVKENANNWMLVFDLGCYESLSYLRSLQKFLRAQDPVRGSQSALSSVANRLCCSFSANSSNRPSTHRSSSGSWVDPDIPAIFKYNFQLRYYNNAEKTHATLIHRFYPSNQISSTDPEEIGEFGVHRICSSVSLTNLFQDSPAFRTAFAARRRKLQLKMNASEEELEELAVLYRFQPKFDIHDRLVGKGAPAPLSGSPYFSISNSSAVAVYPRMDRSLVLGFCSIVDSAQLKSKDGKHMLYAVVACRDPPIRRVFDQSTELQTLSVPGFDISGAAKKINRPLKAPTDTLPPLKFPGIMQRNAEASCMVPLHGVLPNECLNCYEVSLLNLSVHTKVSAMLSDKSLSQTALSDPNQLMSQDATAKTKRQRDFSEVMLSLMHNHPKSAPDVNSFRYTFASNRSFRIGKYFIFLFLLVIVLMLSSASGPGVSALVQYGPLSRPFNLNNIVIGTFVLRSASNL